MSSPPIHTALRADRGWQHVDLRELWRYRELLWFMAMRDVQVRYKQTILGALWAIIQPVMSMIVFSVIFGNFAKLPSDGVPYPVFVLAGLLPWQLFSNMLGQTSNSLVTNGKFLTKIYFPRLIMPLSAALSGVVDFCIAFVVLLVLMAYYGIAPTWGILLLPFFVLFSIMAALSVGLWLSALNIRYRDVKYVVPFLTQVWQYASPVVYAASLVPEKWQVLYGLNPMAGVLSGFRWALLGTGSLSWPLFATSLVATFLLFVGGLYYFRKMESSFADFV